jgi:hypothetical protein
VLKVCDSKGRCYTEDQLAKINKWIEEDKAFNESMEREFDTLAWRPIEELTNVYKVRRRMFVVRGYIPKQNYKTDPYCVWLKDDGTYARWPHPFAPCEFLELPA